MTTTTPTPLSLELNAELATCLWTTASENCLAEDPEGFEHIEVVTNPFGPDFDGATTFWCRTASDALLLLCYERTCGHSALMLHDLGRVGTRPHTYHVVLSSRRFDARMEPGASGTTTLALELTPELAERLSGEASDYRFADRPGQFDVIFERVEEDDDPFDPGFSGGTVTSCETASDALLLLCYERACGHAAIRLHNLAAAEQETGDACAVLSSRPFGDPLQSGDAPTTTLSVAVTPDLAEHLWVMATANVSSEQPDRFYAMEKSAEPNEAGVADGTMFWCDSASDALLLCSYERACGHVALQLRDLESGATAPHHVVLSSKPFGVRSERGRDPASTLAR